MRHASLMLLLCLAGCTTKHPSPPTVATPPPPARSQMPPSTTELIVVKHCVITDQENANTVSCACEPVTTIVDKEGGRRTLVCKKMKPEPPPK